jgi:hypothetical protein
MHQGLHAYRATGAELERVHWLALLAEAYHEVGQLTLGLDALNEVALCDKHAERPSRTRADIPPFKTVGLSRAKIPLVILGACRLCAA